MGLGRDRDPGLGRALERRDDLLLLGQEPALAAESAPFVRTLQWAFLPALWAVVLRCFFSALQRPGWILAIWTLALPLNLAIAWVLMFGKLGFAPRGLAGAGVATTVSSLFMFVGLALVTMLDRRLRRYRLFGRWWRPDATSPAHHLADRAADRRHARSSRSGCSTPPPS